LIAGKVSQMARKRGASTSGTLFDKALEVVGVYWQRVSRALDRFADKPPTKLLLIAAVILYLVAQAYVTFPSFAGYPLRDDDAYGYLAQAAEVTDGCFFQDCPALNDLREQVTEPAEDPEIAGYRNRIYHRFFVVYHPLHSFALAGMDALGIDFETGYDILYTLGKILVPLAVAYWLITVWGTGPAITALLLLTPMIFGGPGLHIIKMHTFVLAFALILWAEIYKRSSRAGVMMILFIVLMSLQHPLGKLLSVASLVFYAAFAKWPLARKHIFVISTSSVLLLGFFAAPTFLERPELTFDPVTFYPGNWDYYADFFISVEQIRAGVFDWLKSFGSPLFFVPIVLLGLLSYSENERRKLLVVMAMMASLFVGGVIYVVPWYGAISFARIWPLVAVFLTGAFASGLHYLARALIERQRRVVGMKSSKLIDRKRLLTQRGGVVFGSLIAVIVVVFSLTTNLANNISSYISVSRSLPKGNFINQEQPGIIKTEAGENHETTILYMDEYAVHYYLTYGGLQYGAIFYTPLRLTPDLDTWLAKRKDDIAYVVNRNPIFMFPHTAEGNILLEKDTALRIESQAGSKNLEILVWERSTEVSLIIIYGPGEQDSITLRLPAGPTEWVALPEEVGTIDPVTIHIPDVGSPVSIAGMRAGGENETLWPWDQGFAFVYETSEESIVVELNSAVIVSPLVFDLTVLDDRGFLILAKVNH
jgi:hypothetical protein